MRAINEKIAPGAARFTGVRRVSRYQRKIRIRAGPFGTRGHGVRARGGQCSVPFRIGELAGHDRQRPSAARRVAPFQFRRARSLAGRRARTRNTQGIRLAGQRGSQALDLV
jgi:hypothetical protein